MTSTILSSHHLVTNTSGVISHQRLSGPIKSHKVSKQEESLEWGASTGNPDCQSSANGETTLSWADIPDIPHAWELLESPQVWINGDLQGVSDYTSLNDILYDTTPTHDFESNLSSTSSPLLKENDTFNTSCIANSALEPLIPTIELNEQQLLPASQETIPRRNVGAIDSISYLPLSVTPLAKTGNGTSESSHIKESCSTGPRHRTKSSQRHKTAGSDTHSSQESDEERLAERRRKNKLAARKLRQKKLDQVSELEGQLEEMRKERDALRLRAAKSEGELLALRQMIDQKMASG